MDLEKVRNYLKASALGSFFLILLSFIYYILFQIRKALYFVGLLKSKSIKTPIICFGNISSGGTGKTSAVIEVASLLGSKGLKTAVITSGYARRKKTKSTVVISSKDDSDISLCGDEAMVIKDLLLSLKVPVLINSKKSEAASKAQELFSPNYILMDDGFQHFALKRTFDFVLINAREGFEGRLLPYGNLREPYSAIGRASGVIFTHCERLKTNEIEKLKEKAKRFSPKIPLFCSKHIFEKIYRPSDGKILSREEYENIYFSIFSAIGDPESFEKSVSDRKIKVKRALRFTDHRDFSPSDLKSISDICHDSLILTTYKDFVRLPQYWKMQQKEKLYIFSVRFKFFPKDEHLFLKLLGL